MSLSGSFSTMPLTDLLQWLGQARKSGTLLLHGERYTKKLLIKEGKIISSASDDPTDHLGHFLLRQGKLKEADLRRAIETQQQTRAMLGKILVTVGAISEEDLKLALVQKAEETVFGLFLWADGRFEFLDADLSDKITVPLSLAIEDVLLKGLTWFDELRQVRTEFASPRSILGHGERPLPEVFADSEALPRRIYELLDGRRTIADICLEVHASEFMVSKLLFLMHKHGYVRVLRKVDPEEHAPRKTFSGLLDEAKSLLRAGEPQEAMKVLDEARPLSPTDMELRRLDQEVRTAFLEKVARNGLHQDRIPRLLRPIESLTGEPLTPEEGFILSRVNGTWDIRSIVSLCPFPEADALVHLQRLKEKGILGLDDPA